MLAQQLKDLYLSNSTLLKSMNKEKRIATLEEFALKDDEFFANSEGYFVIQGLYRNSLIIPNSLTKEEIEDIVDVTLFINKDINKEG